MKLKLRRPRPTKKLMILALFVLLIAVASMAHIKLLLDQGGRSQIVFRGAVVKATSPDEIKRHILARSSSIELRTARQTLEVESEYLGAVVDDAALDENIEAAHSWQHFIPLWGIKTLRQDAEAEVIYAVDEVKLSLATRGLAQQLSSTPQPAGIIQEGEGVVVRPEVAGLDIDIDAFEAAIKNYLKTNFVSGYIAVPTTEIQPEITTESLQAIMRQYEFISSSSLDVSIDGYSTVLNAAALFGLIDVESSSIGLNSESVDQLIAEWSKQVSSVATNTYVEYVDDVEVSRISGQSGRSLSTEDALSALNEWLNNPEVIMSIELNTTVVESTVEKSFSYTDTSLGLQKELEAWDASNAGTYYISIKEIGGQGREAHINSNTPVVMASTYKMFLSVAAYKMAENNELSLATVIHEGKDVEECIRLGIVYSNNPCMVALGEHIGWGNAESIVQGLGFSGVRLNNYLANGSYDGDKLAPAANMTNLLVRLQSGTLISDTNKNQLLSYMKVSSYRSGIPAGSGGSVVANKVGFLYSYIHDMGIVYGDNSTYAITILTSNSSWGKIDSVSQLVHGFLD